MPLTITNDLPAKKILMDENLSVLRTADVLNVPPLKIAIVNIMPMKQITEVQLLRLLGSSPLPVEITLLYMKTHTSKNTSAEYLSRYYKVFDDVSDQHFDGLIITGAPIEKLEFEEVNYWPELSAIMRWSRKNARSTLHICWGAQAGLYYHYGVRKYSLPKKMFGIFEHTVTRPDIPLFTGFDDVFPAPHSRHTEIRAEDILKTPGVELLSESDKAGVYIAASRDHKMIFVTGHSEYDPLTLREEYERDISRGAPIDMPENYFKNGDAHENPVVTWRSHAYLLFRNWLENYAYGGKYGV